jgi:hypothetical protein
MRKPREDMLIQCPYYRDEERQVMRCEGLEAGGCLHLGFPDRYKMRHYKQTYCRADWPTCLIAQLLNDKYDYKP